MIDRPLQDTGQVGRRSRLRGVWRGTEPRRWRSRIAGRPPARADTTGPELTMFEMPIWNSHLEWQWPIQFKFEISLNLKIPFSLAMKSLIKKYRDRG